MTVSYGRTDSDVKSIVEVLFNMDYQLQQMPTLLPDQQRYNPPRSVKGIFLAKDKGTTKNGTAIETVVVEADSGEIVVATSYKTILIDVS